MLLGTEMHLRRLWGFAASLEKEMPVSVTVKSSRLRSALWPGPSPCSDRITLEYLLSYICSGAWSTDLFIWLIFHFHPISLGNMHRGRYGSPTGSHVISA